MVRSGTMFGFAFATLFPAALIGLSVLVHGAWSLAALLYVAGLVAVLDGVLPVDDSAETRSPLMNEPGRGLCAILAGTHFAMLIAVIWGISSSFTLLPYEKACLFLSAGLYFGQVSNANAHELIHAATRGWHRLGCLIYISLLFGHHATAHRLVHHRWVATPLDPNSAPRGQSFYAYAPSAWIGSFRKGFVAAERQRLRVQYPMFNHPYVAVIAGQIILIELVILGFGGKGLLVYLGLCAYAQMQLLLSDYVQHYGLTRHKLSDGRWCAVSEAHSWDAPHVLSGLTMLYAPRHSDHHLHPGTPFHALSLGTPETTPRLPYSLPVMAAIALVPPLWRRVMHRRLDRFLADQCAAPMDFPATTA